MPSFDVSSEVDWQEIDNACQQTLKEASQRFDFKGQECKVEVDRKLKQVKLWCSGSEKLSALFDLFQTKAVKRGISLLVFEEGEEEAAFGGSARQVLQVQAGISKEKAKTVIQALKNGKFKVQAQIQDEQVRVTGKHRDDLQAAIAHLKSVQDTLKLSMQFGNFRN
jgi:cyclic-di-GMP-binding protein